MSRTYLNLTNDAIQESGASLQTFATNGSDWETLSDPSSRRFKAWIARAWKDIQQEANDWEFLNTRAVVSIDPGIEFYTDAVLASYPAPSMITIYDRDNVIKYSNVLVQSVYDLSTKKAPEAGATRFGYLNVAVPEGTDIDYSFKSGNDYFFYGANYSVASSYFLLSGDWPPPLGTRVDVWIGSGDPDSVTKIYPAAATITAYDGTGSPTMSWTFDLEDINDHITNQDGVYLVYGTSFSSTGDDSGHAIVTSQQGTAKCYIRGWRSYDFSEEVSSDDYQIAIKEVHEKTFAVITKNYPEAGREQKLINMPNQIFSNSYDLASTRPSGTPTVIAEDVEGRWRLYPPISRPVTLRFDYTRKPQVLVTYTDYPWYLPDEYTDLVMWKALMYYGEFDEQPSIYMRAQKHYRDLLQRFEWQFRPKLRFVPHRLYR